MGLDITAYRGLKRDKQATLDDDGNPVDYENRFRAHETSVRFTEDHWPGRSEGVEANAVYSFADRFSFRAGSYSGHGWFRNHLAQLVGIPSAEAAWDRPDDYPFAELINFADNEGIIGSRVAAKLARDFAEHADKAASFAAGLAREGDYFLDIYGRWRKAFDMAADGGAVDFH